MSCTGHSASWCPVCGDCTCERTHDGECCFDGKDCPLHGVTSKHAETVSLDECRAKIGGLILDDPSKLIDPGHRVPPLPAKEPGRMPPLSAATIARDAIARWNTRSGETLEGALREALEVAGVEMLRENLQRAHDKILEQEKRDEPPEATHLATGEQHGQKGLSAEAAEHRAWVERRSRELDETAERRHGQILAALRGPEYASLSADVATIAMVLVRASVFGGLTRDDGQPLRAIVERRKT